VEGKCFNLLVPALSGELRGRGGTSIPLMHISCLVQVHPGGQEARPRQEEEAEDPGEEGAQPGLRRRGGGGRRYGLRHFCSVDYSASGGLLPNLSAQSFRA